MTTIYSKSGTDAAISAATGALTPEDVGADPAGAAAGAVAAHTGATNPHPEYLTPAELPATYPPSAHAGSHATGQPDALTPASIGAATAAQGAKADASDVHQITLTEPLVLTIPEGHPAGQVYRCAITQDGTGGHTVTYGGAPVTVAPAAGASTTVELHPVGAGYVVRYPVAAPTYTLPNATGVDDTAAMQAVLTAGAGKRVTGRPGASYIISAPLVISTGTTLDLTGCTVTLKAGSNCRMLQNVALLGSGARDTDITIRGGYWDRGANGGTTANGHHSIVVHRADRVSVSDIRYNASGACKYSVYLCDVTHARVERCDFTSTSDGVHVTGPSSHITIRDITGATDDDLVSITGRDYETYELTAGGGSISDVVIERITFLGAGSANIVKLVPGATMTMSGVIIRNLFGAPTGGAVHILSDTVHASTTGGTVEEVLIDGVIIQTGGIGIDHPDVRTLEVRNLTIANGLNTMRAISLGVSGAHVDDLRVTGISTVTPSLGTAIHVGTGATVDRLKVQGAAFTGGTATAGNLLAVAGTVGICQMSVISQSAGGSTVYVASGGSCPLVTIEGLHSTANHPINLSADTACEVSVTGVSGLPSSGWLTVNASTSGALVLRASRITGTATTHMFRTGTQAQRAVGAEIRVDVSKLTPVAGDIVTNTNAALGCGTGPVISNGTKWRHLYTGAETA